ncbi:MAG: acyl-CoA dehydrogenase family protein [Deltaproteobacteria bacterium]|nr:acyl-CoA dehydrogenase family protein [Deltaproteobacteria bacterium]
MDFSFTDEQKAFREQVLKFSQKELAPLAEEADWKGEFCWEAWKKIGAFGLLGLTYPEEYGGSSSDVVTACLAGEAVAYGGAEGGLCLAWGAHTYLCGDTILVHGTEEQKGKYLPKLSSGEWVGAMGLTEPGAGSDAASIRTTAVRKGDYYLLNGTKMFITNGPIADVLVIIAVTDKEKKTAGISAFIVEKGSPGFSVGRELKKMGVKASTTGELIFEDCVVPAENILRKEGDGFFIALGTVEWDRSTLMAPFLGGLEYALDACVKYAKERVQFGRPIASFQAIQHKLADMKVIIEAMRLLIFRVAWLKDQGKFMNPVEAAEAKLFVGEFGMKAASDAVQIHGGYGLMHEYPVERIFRDAKLGAIGGGTSEIMRLIISRSIFSAGKPI